MPTNPSQDWMAAALSDEVVDDIVEQLSHVPHMGQSGRGVARAVLLSALSSALSERDSAQNSGKIAERDKC